MGDAELVRLTLEGERSAYEQLVQRWGARILAFCHAKVRSVDAAEDLAQEAMLRGYRALATLTEPQKFGAWLRGIALRVCFDWLNDRRRGLIAFSALSEEDMGATIESREESADQRAAQADDVTRLLSEVERLPSALREVLLLYYYDDLTYDDLAEMLGVSHATINARLTKARALLRTRMNRTHA
jgi:RNA polymerase sigma-70 factor (ECF subfamily)